LAATACTTAATCGATASQREICVGTGCAFGMQECQFELQRQPSRIQDLSLIIVDHIFCVEYQCLVSFKNENVAPMEKTKF